MERIKTLTSPTSKTFRVMTETSSLAAQHLLPEFEFDFVLLVVSSTNPAKKFFGQTRQRMRRRFYIGIADIMTEAKMQVLHQQLKLDIVPDKSLSYTCPSCTEKVSPDNIKVVQI